jgi:hypothetical protein
MGSTSAACLWLHQHTQCASPQNQPQPAAAAAIAAAAAASTLHHSRHAAANCAASCSAGICCFSVSRLYTQASKPRSRHSESLACAPDRAREHGRCTRMWTACVWNTHTRRFRMQGRNAPALHTLLHFLVGMLLFLQTQRERSRYLQRAARRRKEACCIPLQKRTLIAQQSITAQGRDKPGSERSTHPATLAMTHTNSPAALCTLHYALCRLLCRREMQQG